MSELSNKIRSLRGNLSGDEAARRCGLSRESFYRIERGGSVKLSTLHKIAKHLNVEDSDWLAILVAWLKTEAGEDASKLWIDTKESSPLHDSQVNEVARAMMLFESLNPSERSEVAKAMQRKEVIACLPAINRVWEKFNV